MDNGYSNEIRTTSISLENALHVCVCVLYGHQMIIINVNLSVCVCVSHSSLNIFSKNAENKKNPNHQLYINDVRN